MQTGFQHFDPMDKRIACEIRVRARHLDERKLEREPRVRALPLVLQDDCEQVDEAQHGRLGKLVGLLAKPFARLLREGQRLRDVTDVLDEQELPEVLEQLLRELAQVLPALGELLDEHERARDVAVDDRVAEPEEHVLLDRGAELEHVLYRDRLRRRGGQLVEHRDRVPVRPVGTARDERERGVGGVDALAVADLAKRLDELLHPRTLEHERLAA